MSGAPRHFTALCLDGIANDRNGLLDFLNRSVPGARSYESARAVTGHDGQIDAFAMLLAFAWEHHQGRLGWNPDRLARCLFSWHSCSSLSHCNEVNSAVYLSFVPVRFGNNQSCIDKQIVMKGVPRRKVLADQEILALKTMGDYIEVKLKDVSFRITNCSEPLLELLEPDYGAKKPLGVEHDVDRNQIIFLYDREAASIRTRAGLPLNLKQIAFAIMVSTMTGAMPSLSRPRVERETLLPGFEAIKDEIRPIFYEISAEYLDLIAIVQALRRAGDVNPSPGAQGPSSVRCKVRYYPESPGPRSVAALPVTAGAEQHGIIPEAHQQQQTGRATTWKAEQPHWNSLSTITSRKNHELVSTVRQYNMGGVPIQQPSVRPTNWRPDQRAMGGDSHRQSHQQKLLEKAAYGHDPNHACRLLGTGAANNYGEDQEYVGGKKKLLANLSPNVKHDVLDRARAVIEKHGGYASLDHVTTHALDEANKKLFLSRAEAMAFFCWDEKGRCLIRWQTSGAMSIAILEPWVSSESQTWPGRLNISLELTPEDLWEIGMDVGADYKSGHVYASYCSRLWRCAIVRGKNLWQVSEMKLISRHVGQSLSREQWFENKHLENFGRGRLCLMEVKSNRIHFGGKLEKLPPGHAVSPVPIVGPPPYLQAPQLLMRYTQRSSSTARPGQSSTRQPVDGATPQYPTSNLTQRIAQMHVVPEPEPVTARHTHENSDNHSHTDNVVNLISMSPFGKKGGN